MPFRQFFQFVPEGRAPGGAEGHRPGFFLHRPVQQAEALGHICLPVGVGYRLYVIIPPLLQEAGSSGGHGLPHVTLPGGMHHGKPPGGAAHGQGAGHPVGTVVQFLHNRQHPGPDLRLHIGPVVEHPIHRADGNPGPLRDDFNGCPHGVLLRKFRQKA